MVWSSFCPSASNVMAQYRRHTAYVDPSINSGISSYNSEISSSNSEIYTLKILKPLCVEHHPCTATAVYMLGNVTHKMKDFLRAQCHFDRVLESCQKFYS